MQVQPQFTVQIKDNWPFGEDKLNTDKLDTSADQRVPYNQDLILQYFLCKCCYQGSEGSGDLPDFQDCHIKIQ